MSTNKNIIQKINQKNSLILFVISFLTVFLLTIIFKKDVYFFDSLYYDSLSKTFMDTGAFSLNSFPETYRGVIFPLIISFFSRVAVCIGLSEQDGWLILISLVIAILITALPIIFTSVCGKKISFFRKLLPLIFIMIFWYGLILYPLSDLIAVSFLVFAMSLLLIVVGNPTNNIFLILIRSFICGALLYSAYNTRTIYLLPAVLLVVIMLVANRKIGLKIQLFIILGILLGVVAIGSVQGYVNLIHHGVFSINVITDNLSGWQLNIGMTYSQYETYIGSSNIPSQYPSPSLKFVDAVGTNIYNQEGLKTQPLSTLGMIALILKHPFEFVGIYTRHFVNMLNPVWGGGAYVTDLYSPKIYLSIINYILLFCSCKYMFKKGIIIKGFKNNIICIIVLLLPCLFILPGAVEIRFFIPMYLVIYGIFSYCINFKNLLKEIKEHWIRNAIVFVCVFFLLCAIWSNTYANTEHNMLIGLF